MLRRVSLPAVFGAVVSALFVLPGSGEAQQLSQLYELGANGDHATHGIAVVSPQEASDTIRSYPVFEKELPKADYNQSISIQFEYPPGYSQEEHEHPADLFAYVLSGRVKSKLKGEKAKTFETGEMWWEPKGSIHQTFENLSETEPARLLVIYLVRPSSNGQ